MTDGGSPPGEATGWHRVRLEGTLEVSVPPEVRESGGHAYEQSVGVWEGSGITLIVDASGYADPLAESRTGRPPIKIETVDGRPARIASYEDDDGARVVAVHFDGDQSHPAGVTVTARADPAVDVEILLRIVRSVRRL